MILFHKTNFLKSVTFLYALPWVPFNLLLKAETIKTWRNFCWKPGTYKVEKKLKSEKAGKNSAEDQFDVGVHISSTCLEKKNGYQFL